jgi:hypothetical protein
VLLMRKMHLKVKTKWHTIGVGYYEMLLEGCLDSQLRHKLKKKISYHKLKMGQLIN